MAQSKVLDEQAIRERAYQLWLDRGRAAGSSLEDWLEAERSLLAQGWRRYGLRELAGELRPAAGAAKREPAERVALG